MTSADPPHEPFKVVIAGGGVAALEAALVLRKLGGGRIATTLLAPNEEFVYRPMTVREPFAYAVAKRYRLDPIARDMDVELHHGSLKWVAPEPRVVHTEAGEELSYDALLLAVGARLYRRYKHAVTIDDARLDEVLHGLIQDVEEGRVKKLAFVVPSGAAWPLPIYELALMTAARAYDMNVELSITIATPEDAPLAIFGSDVSDSVRSLLEQSGILTLTSAHCEVHEGGRVAVHPGARDLYFDQIVALPELVGPSVPGVPADGAGGFIPVDVHGKVRGLDRVFAAGDATTFPVKHGGVAAQQADVAAQAIAALAGVAPQPPPFHPEIHGMLLTGGEPLYLSAYLTGGHGSSSQLTDTPTWSPPTKIAAKYLAPYLAQLGQATEVAR